MKLVEQPAVKLDPANDLREHLGHLADARDYIATLEADILLAKTNARAAKAEARAAKEEVRAMKLEAKLARAEHTRAFFIESLSGAGERAGVQIIDVEADPDTILHEFNQIECSKRQVPEMHDLLRELDEVNAQFR